MATGEAYGLGYTRVDDDPNVSVLLATMDATAGREATRRLRAWERDQLQLGGGERLLDVGCGLGEDGELVGIDASAEMVAAALATVRSARCRVRFAVGDAVVLDEPDDHFDVVPSTAIHVSDHVSEAVCHTRERR